MISYNIFDGTAPAMPKPGKGTEFVKFILSKASRDMREALLPMAFPAAATYLSEVRFRYNDGILHEMCGMEGHLVAPSGSGKGQLTRLMEAITERLQEHDAAEYRKISTWENLARSKAKDSKQPPRPEACFRCPPGNFTNASFLQNAMALEKQGGLSQYINLPEVEMVDRICGGHQQVSEMLRVIYDCGRTGALRATADGVTGSAVMRVNLTVSSTPEAARQFYRRELTNGFFGRINFAYKPRGTRSGKIPRQGQYDETFRQQLGLYLDGLTAAKGDFHVAELNRVAGQLAREMADLAEQTDDDLLFELSHRCILSAWKKGAMLWLLNQQTWARSIADFVRWFCYYDLWSKLQVFGGLITKASTTHGDDQKQGPQNMLTRLPDTFSLQQLEALRLELGKTEKGAKHQLDVWKHRRYVTFSAETGLYTKVIKN